MAILTNTVQPECLLQSPRMPRRILQEEPPSPSSLEDLQISVSQHDPGVFFFLGGIIMLIMLLILVFIFWRCIKRPAKVLENTAITSQQHGNLRKASYIKA
ncbi:hypothetical protein VNO78_22988 [Psophocarpus tetragonolobus]|uniref:Uncharacterized protein n=1 Tax=Psophocarpus tetragonolobus TaxID=3891 RepID=A0AAN9S5R1_PSOTE